MADQVDVAVLGGGSGGAAVALRLAEAGRSVAMIEERLVGGECPYFACMPSKAMLQAAARGMPWPEAVAFRDDASGHRDDSDTARQVEQAGVEVIRGHGVVTGRGELIVGARTLRWRDLVVATGAAPSRPPIDGLDDVDVWTSEDALSNRELPRSLVVLGGGAVGCELSQIYARFGADVTVVETAERLLADEPDFVGDALAAALHDDGVTLALDSTVQCVGAADGGIRVHGEDGSTHDGERLVIATGKQPRTEGLGLERLGLLASDEGLPTDDRCRVIDNVWAVGDVTGVAPYTHTANYQARVVADNLTGARTTADYSAIPRTVYTDPVVFAVGDTSGDGSVTADMDVGDTARAVIAQREDGHVRLYVDPDRRVLVGAVVVGPEADAWGAELTVAIRARVDVDILADVVHAFPTFGESLGPPLNEIAHQLRKER